MRHRSIDLIDRLNECADSPDELLWNDEALQCTRPWATAGPQPSPDLSHGAIPSS